MSVSVHCFDANAKNNNNNKKKKKRKKPTNKSILQFQRRSHTVVLWYVVIDFDEENGFQPFNVFNLSSFFWEGDRNQNGEISQLANKHTNKQMKILLYAY